MITVFLGPKLSMKSDHTVTPTEHPSGNMLVIVLKLSSVKLYIL